MTYFLLIPFNKDILFHINFFFFSYYANIIRKSWINYSYHKNFIIDHIFNLRLIHSMIDNDFIYNVADYFTYFFFKKLTKLTNGREKNFNLIFYFYHTLALSIDDYEWSNGNDNLYYHYNRLFCFSIAHFFNWTSILHILQ
jgi:hypothetical protein